MKLDKKYFGVLCSTLMVGFATVTELNAMTTLHWSYVHVSSSYLGDLITTKRVDLHLRQIPGQLPEKLEWTPFGNRVNYDTYLLCDKRGPSSVPTGRVAVRQDQSTESIEQILSCEISQSEFAYHLQEYTLNYILANEDYAPYYERQLVLVKIDGRGIHYDERYVRVLPDAEKERAGIIELQVDLGPLFGRGAVTHVEPPVYVVPTAPTTSSPTAPVHHASASSSSSSGPSPTAERVVNIPDSVANTSGNSFYVMHDETRNLWFAMELISANNVDWWRKRLAHDAYFHFRAQALIKQKASMQEPPTQPEIDALEIYSPFVSDIEKNTKFQELFTAASKCEPWEARSKLSPYDFDKNLMGAMRGFEYNLRNYTEGGNATWVAYISSRPIVAPPYSLHDFDIASPDIKIAMTVKMSSSFYSPLGIYRSPIADTFDKEHGLNLKNLSMLFHSRIARIVLGRINPDVKYALVRPLASMRKILESSGLHNYSISPGSIGGNKACVTYKGGGHGIYATPMHDFSIVDPSINTVYKFNESHWFCRSPFLAGQEEEEFFRQFPFFLIDARELADLRF